MSDPTLIYDGDCGFCRRWVERWLERTEGGFRAVPLQEWNQAEPPRDALLRAVHFVSPEGQVSRGAQAVFLALATRRACGWPLWLYRHGFAALAERVYRWVSQHRAAASRLARAAWGDAVPGSYEVMRWVFLRALSLIYGTAFISLWVQLMGLIGSQGIWPAREYLPLVHERLGADAWTSMPTLFYWGASDAALHAGCAVGVACCALLAAGLWPRGSLFILWALYLSFQHAGYVFMGYQWDLLLLEVGLLAIPFAPAGLWPRRRRYSPSWASLLLLRLLLFRLMFMSGAVKLLSGDSTWSGLTALRYHYWTQPLPAWTSAIANDLPDWFSTFSCAAMFAIELGAPFFIFGVRAMRLFAFAALTFLQIAILLTGNYGFFNWLTVLLCWTLLDDRVVRRLSAALVPAPQRRPIPELERWLRRGALALFTALFALAGLAEMRAQFRKTPASGALGELLGALEPFRAVNSYGLFRVMTTERAEIILEGSDDGESWRPYEFKWKPGRLDHRPAFVAPHQPRLDWQMWFAALGSCRRNAWFLQLEQRLLQGSGPVLGLFKGNPFPDAPPRYLRSILYQYRFTSAAERKKGIWWERVLVGPYCPTLSATPRDP